MTETPGLDVEKLAAPLDASRIKTREGGNGRSLSFIETHDAIRTANDIFGYGAWGHEIVELRTLEPITVAKSDGKTGLQVGYVCIVRLTVRGCVPVSGVGYGDAVEYRASAPVTAHELAAKEAESDALKRALKNYGDQFGLALYDKAALQSGHVTNGDTPQTTDPTKISQAQSKRLFAIAREKDVSLVEVKRLVKEIAGVDHTAEVPKAKYDALVEAVEAAALPF